MSLKHALFGGMAALLLLVLIVSQVVTTSAMRSHVENQLASQAQDTANALAISMSQASGDRARLDSVLQAVADGGFWQRLTWQPADGGAPLVRELQPVPIDVPAWFAALHPLPAPVAKAEVMAGWLLAGELQVQAHPGQAYRDLWHLWRNQALWLLAIAALGLAAAAALLRVVMKPLHSVEAQARAMADDHFPPPAPLPRTPELANVVRAINDLVLRLQDSFSHQTRLTEELRNEARRDPVTGLPNRRDFDARVETAIGATDGLANSAAVLVTLRNLDRYNIKAGRHAGDALLRAMASRLQDATRTWPDAIIARRSGTDLAVVLPGIGVERARTALHRMAAAIADLPVLKQPDNGLQAPIGMSFTSTPRRRRRLLADADAAVRQAMDAPGGTAFVVDDGGAQAVSGAIRRTRSWQDAVTRAVTTGDLRLERRAWVRSHDHRLLQHAAVAVPATQDSEVPGSAFQPLAARLGLAPELDRWLVQQVLDQAADQPVPATVALSLPSLHDQAFCDWLVATCRSSGQGARLLVELPEWALSSSPERVELLFRVLRHEGIGVSISQFGTGGLPLSWLQRLGLAQVKVDASFVDHLDRRLENQFFLRALCQIAEGIDARVLADGVRSATQFKLLAQLGVVGGAGPAATPEAGAEDLP